ncbi:MAG: FAD-binding oxidoreductase [Alphaproteobacteria bacterium]|nr:FAD-binding oxidoreductase [Alphaproteobacteria bacterium]
MTAQTAPMVVIGAGIVGACCAFALAAEGHDVVVIDENEPGSGCSYGNAGQFNLGTTLPIALPGMWRQVPKWLTDPRGPLAVRWPYLPRAAPWLLRWLWEGRMERASRHSRALQALMAPCHDVYRTMLGPEAAGLLVQSGHLHVWERAHLTAGDRLALAMMADKGVHPQALDAGAIRAIEPALAPIYQRGLLFPGNGFTTNPARLVQTILRRSGAAVRAERALGFERQDNEIKAVRTNADTIRCAGVVIAAGHASRDLAAQLGLRVPLEVERGYHAMLPDPGVRLRVPVSNGEHTFVATPMEHGLRFAGTVEIAGTAPPPDWRRADILLSHARRMLPGLNTDTPSRWMGFRPSFPDSLPAIGHLPGLANAIAAFGHGHYGISLSPMTGQIVADLVAGRVPELDPLPYRPDRF